MKKKHNILSGKDPCYRQHHGENYKLQHHGECSKIQHHGESSKIQHQKTDNTEKPAALGTHDEEKQDINTTQHVSNTTIRRQTHITDLRHQPPTNNDRTSETTTDITTRNPKCKDTK